MGLDQSWLFKEDDKDLQDLYVAGDVTDGFLEGLYEFYTHRKQPALEFYMAELANEQGLIGDFNCAYLRIHQEDLNDLKEHVTNKSLNENATGFFWGGHQPEDYEDFLKAIDEAQQHLDDGNAVYYSSWW